MKRFYLLLVAVFVLLMVLPLFLDNYALGIWAFQCSGKSI